MVCREVSLQPLSGWPQKASLREAIALRALKGRSSKAQGVSPGILISRKTALKGRRGLLRPFRALSLSAVVPRAHTPWALLLRPFRAPSGNQRTLTGTKTILDSLSRPGSRAFSCLTNRGVVYLNRISGLLEVVHGNLHRQADTMATNPEKLLKGNKIGGRCDDTS